MHIKAVTFDVGGTLIEPWPSVGQVYAEVAARHGVKNVSAELLQTRFKTAWRARKRFNDTRAGWEELVDEAFRGLATTPPSKSFFSEIYDRFAQPEAWHVFEDVRPALESLATQGLKLGVISNWDERLRELLCRLQLDVYFDTIVISCEVHAAKPAPAIFERAAAILNLPSASILHVGDSLEMDLRGAEAAGFRSVQVVRRERSPGDGPIHSLLQVVGLI